MFRPKYEPFIDKWLEDYEGGQNYASIARNYQNKFPDLTFKSLENAIRRIINKHYLNDKEILSENVRLSKQKQRYQDLNRIERKAFREHARIENAIEKYNIELIHILSSGLKYEPVLSNIEETEHKIIVQLSDLHLNELIELPGNTYDFGVASKRLFKLATRIKEFAKFYNCSKIIIVFGGDFLNSDRRLDELLNMATNRAKATSLAFILLRYFILDLAARHTVTAVGVTGNESRAKKELGWSDILASDSYDFTIYDMLRLHLKGIIDMAPMDPNEALFRVNKFNCLAVHGHQLNAKNPQDSVQKLIGKYATKGILIDHVFAGHIHSTFNSDYYSRNSSLCGSNAYSEEALNYVSKAAQNIHIVGFNSIDSLKVDLQHYDKGYPIESDVDAYNAKSAKKINKGETVFRVVI